LDIKWITTALETIPPKNRGLQQISIYLHYSKTARIGPDVRDVVGERIRQQWLNLDRLLVKFWEPRLIRPKVADTRVEQEEDLRACFGRVLPESTKNGFIDLLDLTALPSCC
jgi:hypothetical protein